MGQSASFILKKSDVERYGLPSFVSTTGNRERMQVLHRNYLIREGRLPRVFQDCMAVSMQIPPLDHAVLMARYPELQSTDLETRQRAWDKFEFSSESEAYRHYKLKRGPQCRSITAR